jgi:hypothetical protein
LEKESLFSETILQNNKKIVEVQLEDITIPTGYSYLCTCDLYSPIHNVFDASRSIMGASERGLGPGN